MFLFYWQTILDWFENAGLVNVENLPQAGARKELTVWQWFWRYRQN